MISLVTENSRAGFISACGFDELIGARMVTLLACYGLACDFCMLWLQRLEDGTPAAAISRFDGRLAVSASSMADLDELSAFAAAIGEYRCIEASPVVCAALGISGRYEEARIMRYGGGLFAEDSGAIDENPKLGDFYAVVAAANPQIAEIADWSGWYTHTSHLLRHGLGFAALIYENGKPVSAGGVFTASKSIAVTSCIATLPEFRGKGYAALITKYLADKIMAQDKIPALLCASDKLVKYYESLGFSRAGKWGQLTLKETI